MPGSANAERSPQLYDDQRRPPPGRHILMFDNCSVHRPIHALKSTAVSLRALPKPPVNTLPQPTRTCQHIAPLPSSPPAPAPPPPLEDSDIPALETILDHEDDEDARQFSRCHRESNSWLLFSGVFALIVTLFITNFTNTPNQRAAQEATHALVQQFAPLSNKISAISVPLNAPGGGRVNVTVPLPFTVYAPCVATEIRDVWVPAACYVSLLLTLTGAMVTLQVKSWLMNCTLSVFPLGPIEDVTALRSAAARVNEYKKTRKEAVSKTAKVTKMLPPLMYSAIGFFVCGVAAKIASCAWLTFVY